MKILNTTTCRELGITGTDADLVMGDEEFVELCQAGESEAASVRAHVLLNPSVEPKPMTEAEAQRIREKADAEKSAAAVERHAQGLMSAYTLARKAAGNPTTRKERLDLMAAIRSEGRDGETTRRLNEDLY
jgi:hypothetical protein